MQLGELGAGSRTGGSVTTRDARTGGGGGRAPEGQTRAPVPGCRRMLENLDLERTNVVASGPLLLLLLEERAGAHAGSATGGEGAASGRRGAAGSARRPPRRRWRPPRRRAERRGAHRGQPGPATSRTIDDASGAATGLAEEEEDPESGKEGRAEDDAKEDERRTGWTERPKRRRDQSCRRGRRDGDRRSERSGRSGCGGQRGRAGCRCQRGGLWTDSVADWQRVRKPRARGGGGGGEGE